MSSKMKKRVAKSGRVYYINPEAYQQRLEEEKRKRREEGGLLRAEYRKQRVKPYCHTIKNDAYLRYYEKKCKIREGYPAWNDMSREESLEYYRIVLDMIYGDEDYRQYKEETKTTEELEEDRLWENKRRKDEEYDGRMDDYHL